MVGDTGEATGGATPTAEALAAARGRRVLSRDGIAVGRLAAVYYDEETGEPEWLGLSGGDAGKGVLVAPARSSAVADDAVTLDFSAVLIESSPRIDEDDVIAETEHDLYNHYGLEHPPLSPEAEQLGTARQFRRFVLRPAPGAPGPP